MASFKSHLVFYCILILLGLLAVGEGVLIYTSSSQAAKSLKQLEQKRHELTALHRVTPFPSEESKAAVEADLARTQVALTRMREELKGRGPAAEQLRAAQVPEQPTDMFFDLANFVEKSREKAQTAAIKFKPDERFGFSVYAQTGPDRDLIAQVFHQRQVTEYLFNALVDARPSELVALQRERPTPKASSSGANAGGQSASASSSPRGAEGDLFEIDPRISARVPGFVEAQAFRLIFIGETDSLRSLLNKLGTFELPIVVRSVEVEPAPVAPSNATSAPQANTLSSIFGTPVANSPAVVEKAKPIVEKVLSKFTVTIEWIDLVSAANAEATPTP